MNCILAALIFFSYALWVRGNHWKQQSRMHESSREFWTDCFFDQCQQHRDLMERYKSEERS